MMRPLENAGFAVGFVWQALAGIPVTLARYRAQTMRTITDMTWGRGSFIVGGGTVPMLVVLGIAIGAGVGIQSFAALDLLGLGSVTGVVSAFANTRELAPIAAAVGFAAQAGCRMTAEIGSMRISEEIDAIESFGLRSVPFVVTTRVLAGAVAIVPTFLIALILSYLACDTVIVLLHGQAGGVYDHYFFQFTSGYDIVAAVVKILVFGVAVILIHCYYGFFASGGPEGVGIASGRAVRASFVAIVGLDMVLTLLLWGVDSAIEFPG
ncbi:Probable phospholipid ABC transporter permease protein mlaE [Nocardia otitidiscaviarum]|uniref:Probable phospholipid ABC transporter permease protein mlaE n=1 Tax=Nocardia otitidiscaviarum TaxID=1823 RepID=A0A378YU34_9NOCA|nr:ABC transporter permease [Nocardia otitidiscaviarum]MBF6181089.1 ABC transporter permease [Nocardia otitidiscaviarum]MBF6487102.1 ABC transporter permease [Nocardia otitidiscaviarum]SUA80695.1 Probable phospholipid ABC transporter permease protein mlaE [Nocardia otitidiscaviarum]